MRRRRRGGRGQGPNERRKKKEVGEGDIFFFFPIKRGKKSEKCLENRQKSIKNEKNDKKTMMRVYVWNLIESIFRFKKMVKKLRARICVRLVRLKLVKVVSPYIGK